MLMAEANVRVVGTWMSVAYPLHYGVKSGAANGHELRALSVE
jgi:hypothetical protein